MWSMSNCKTIRERLALTQAALGEAIGVTQGNVSFYEKGQSMPPDVAKRLIDAASHHGLTITFDHVYGDAPLPELVTPEHPAPIAEAQG